jgi:hypothetical protein
MKGFSWVSNGRAGAVDIDSHSREQSPSPPCKTPKKAGKRWLGPEGKKGVVSLTKLDYNRASSVRGIQCNQRNNAGDKATSRLV